MDRALLVGINKYPGSPLSGCVNDITDMATFLTEHCGFHASNIRLVTDTRATTKAILTRLTWLTKNAKPGDRLFFHYSGHGAQVATRNPAEEVDGLDEVICPVDFDWSNEHLIRDKDFRELFAKVPSGVEFIWVSDSCHSGDLSRDLPPPQTVQKTRIKGLPPPEDIAWRNRIAVNSRLAHRTFKQTATDFSVALVSGCRSEQTSADAWFNGRANGALTYYLLRTLESNSGLAVSLKELVISVRAALKKAGYAQEPQLEGSSTIESRAFLALPD